MELELLTYIILAIASYRITRLVVIDTLFEGLRNKIHTWLFNRSQGKLGFVFGKILDLVSCTWCSGVWISAGTYGLWKLDNPAVTAGIIIAAIAGAQGLLHTVEPDEDHEH